MRVFTLTDGNTRERLGEFESLCKPKPYARVYPSTLEIIHSLMQND